MPLMRYRAVDARGRVSRGCIEAEDPQHLERRLALMNLELIDAIETRTRSGARRVRAGRRELIHFFFALEQLLGAGVPVLDALAELRDSAANASLRALVASLAESIESGSTLSEAMRGMPRTFDAVFVGLVEAGESSGNVEIVLRDLTENLKWQDEQAAKIRKLLAYPAFAGGVLVVVMIFLMTALVPQLVSFIAMTGHDLPAHTRVLIATSEFCVHHWHILVLAPPVLVGACAMLARASPALRFAIDGLKLAAWGVGPILRKVILARFANYFALMYASGIDVPECIRICEGIVGNRVVAKATRRARRRIAEGAGVSESFESSGLFPPLVLRMLRMGETTGALDQSLRSVSYFYERDVQAAVDRLQTVLGPALTLVLGTMLFWIIVSVIGPIYGAITSIEF